MVKRLIGFCVFCRREACLSPQASAKLGKDVCTDCARDL